jgi:hypothetical protein|tara:strand:+ start:1368 stop:1631 length:264 start_codon:yes stop_codon:yes gene_type:complete
MSTIIIPGGGMGFNIMGTAVNLVILYFLFQFVKQNFETFKSNRPLNIVSALKSINVDISGLFQAAPTPPEYESQAAPGRYASSATNL